MKKIAVILFASTAMFITSCGTSADKTKDSDTTISTDAPTGPAPDNSNATNPSLQDSLFADTAGKEAITDTIKK